MKIKKTRVLHCMAALLTAGMLLTGCAPPGAESSVPAASAQTTTTPQTGQGTGTTAGTQAPSLATVPTWTLPSEVDMNESYPTRTVTMKELARTARLKGRTVEMDDWVSFEWSASGFELYGKLEGDILVSAYVDIGPSAAYFEVVVDGDRENARQVCLNVGEGDYYLVQGLPKGYHFIEVSKRTESQFNALLLQEITYTGILEAPPEPVRRIEFIGDSITCGQGYEVQGQITDYPGSEDGVNAYTGQTARALQAEYQVIGLSGWGAFGGGGTDQNRLSRVYEYASYRRMGAGKWDFSVWQPDAVVINLGTNDFNYRNEGHPMTAADYKAEVKNLIRMVRANNPKATIFWAYGMMGTHMQEEILDAIDELKADGETVHYVRLPENWDGGDAHPSKVGHAAAAEVLTKAMRETLGWG